MVRAFAIFAISLIQPSVPYFAVMQIAAESGFVYLDAMSALGLFRLALFIAIVWGGLVYAGFASELLKGAVAPINRFILIVGFLIGTSAAAQFVVGVGIKKQLRRIKRIRSRRNSP